MRELRAGEGVDLSLADAKRLVRLLDAYDDIAGKASKWGYVVDAPATCWDAAARLRRALAGRLVRS